MRTVHHDRISDYVGHLTPDGVYELQRRLRRFSKSTFNDFLKLKLTKNSSAARVVAVNLMARTLSLRSSSRSGGPSQLRAIEIVADLVDGSF